MKTVGAFVFGDEPSGGTTGDPGVMEFSEEPVDVSTSSPCVTSLWLGVEDVRALTALL